MKTLLKIIITLMAINHGIAQEPVYFNKIYNEQNGITTGTSMVEIDGGYAGYGATINNSSVGQKLVFIKISLSGEQLIWKQYGNNNQAYYPGNVGGALIKTIDNNLALVYHTDFGGITYSSLIKLDYNLDTIWKRDYITENKVTMTLNTIQTSDNGFLHTGSVQPAAGDYLNSLIIKTDSLGDIEWYKTYEGIWSEHGEKSIETPDGGYLIGGYFWKPGYDHSLDAMVIKTDSLSNEEWTNYYGNPDVDDDMALVAMADDGNYLVATIYGDHAFSSSNRFGRPWIIKLNNQGQIIEQNKLGPYRLESYIKNFRKVNYGYILTGFSYETDSSTFQYYSGWILKLDNNLDSVWYRDYIHGDETWDNFFYGAYSTTDNGYIAIGKARPEIGNNNMWIVKVDSMGCDTPGCATGTFIRELSPSGGGQGEVKVWPNPTNGKFEVRCSKFEVEGEKVIRIYNSQGMKVEDVKVPEGIDTHTFNAEGWTRGIYFLIVEFSGQLIGSAKIVVR